MALFGKIMVQADGELIRIGDNLGGSRIGMGPIRAGWKIGQRIPRQNFCDRGINRHNQRIAGISRCVYSPALLYCWYRKDLGRPEDLSKALILSEVECLSAAVVYARYSYRAAICKPKLVSAKRRDPFR